ncbi:hypothetical protein DERF_005638 [Dermatophagoides farinae]|uniref:Uncharacterized protein n=1 Tax=Dermatophagoides farinae TaxID=6954 RepID=A0A922I4F4_DERFA|nr:hypothetical protein DERF_005638 [Dermatophagoides farinae]
MARNFRIISDADEDDDNQRGKSNKVSKNLPMIINLGWPTTSIPEIIISAMISRRRICSTSSFILAKIPTIWVPHTQKKQIPFPHTTFVHDDDNKNSIKNQQSVSVNFGYN